MPLSSDLRRFAGEAPARELALTGGDDYELLFTVRPRARSRFETVRQQARGLRLTRIGTVRVQPGVSIMRGGIAEPAPAGYVHFQ